MGICWRGSLQLLSNHRADLRGLAAPAPTATQGHPFRAGRAWWPSTTPVPMPENPDVPTHNRTAGHPAERGVGRGTQSAVPVQLATEGTKLALGERESDDLEVLAASVGVQIAAAGST